MDWSSLDLNGHCKKMRPGRLEETKFVSGGCVEEMLESRIEGCSFFLFPNFTNIRWGHSEDHFLEIFLIGWFPEYLPVISTCLARGEFSCLVTCQIASFVD